MDGVARRRLTDAVTVSRVPIAFAMLLLPRRSVAVSWLFVLGVATDLLDGPLARRLGTDSARGARLDSGADAVFVAASAVAVAATVDQASRRIVGRAAGVVCATRLTTLLLTRRRFGTWSVMHTRLNKATGLGLATVAAVALVRRRMPIGVLGAVAVLAEVAAIEELAMVVTADDYDADRSSLLDRSDGAPHVDRHPRGRRPRVGTAGFDNLVCHRLPR
jgi:CDP-diacylglycerol--glycerol-3-phosphate 3-phosphatidyltransferase